MKKLLFLVVAALVAVPSGMAVGAPASSALAPAPMFVGGGTPLSNGIFFPGTSIEQSGSLYGAPYQIDRGQDIELTMLDEEGVANCHQLTSFKRKRNGRPVFNSKRLCHPGDKSLILTSALKPGIYGGFCPVHFGMYAQIEIKA